ncbi:DEAD/DEAH box helicase [Burkholderia multivorans]|uniref:DEAD/DEAH box helicase n=1 Tax=Burkholderia multivorans TaxID=87883 RepID=UPI0009E0C6D2|nr:DEAD/DEAH box helicase [Burkholderia multivorans]UQN70618.1 DEAD/DEAH box helicase [Burkholderia multivorans]UQN76350.1 DEAD/DEAH box helicase [Burkholderia multivorans]SAK08253.1 DEAD/DEAH box helicase domain-containing protein [Burkholderia multivorans]SAK30226.1 DEAD/DEAH box helicase domain-containing protein [Burkholderia multivorans]HEM7806774.1 DEAD/DEAH box helicase [Burkholderia multivorans]
MTSSINSSPLNAIADQALGLDAAAPAADEPSFASLGLSPEIVSALQAAGYVKPTPVQQRAIPAGIAGRDLLVSSPTGSGKTAAFMLPAIERFAQLQKAQAQQPRAPREANQGERRARRPQPVARPGLLVLTPTRELAMQVTTAASTYGKHLKRLRTVSILGGVAYGQQLMLLAKNPEILVATPGRLLDHLERGRIDLSELKMLVLDEADRMLDMGFIEDIETIVEATPESRQTMLFSATLDGKIGSLTSRLLKDPERIEIQQRLESRANIAQTVHYVDDRDHKDRLLDHLLRDAALDQAIIFTATKLDADQLAGRLADAGFQSAALHGDLPQGARNRTIRALRERRVRVLVATDVAARGIDIPGITHVFNYDLPKFAEDYVHRIGRTGRAGRSGIAVSLVHHAEQGALKRIERFVRSPLPVNVIEGFEPRKTPPRNDRGNGRGRPGGGNGGRRFGGKPGGGHGGHGRSYGGGNGGGWSGKPGASRDGGSRRDGQRSSGPRRSNSAS